MRIVAQNRDRTPWYDMVICGLTTGTAWTRSCPFRRIFLILEFLLSRILVKLLLCWYTLHLLAEGRHWELLVILFEELGIILELWAEKV